MLMSVRHSRGYADTASVTIQSAPSTVAARKDTRWSRRRDQRAQMMMSAD